MNCEEFRSGLETAIENRVSPDFAEAREHLKHCPRCRALSEDYHVIERAVEEWAVLAESPDLSGRVLALLANDQDVNQPPQEKAPSSRFIPILVGLSAVAALFLIAYLTRGSYQIPHIAPVELEVNIEDGGAPPSQLEPPPVEMEHVIGDTKAAYSSLVDSVKKPFEPLKEAVTGGSDDSGGSPSPERSSQDSVSLLSKELVVFNDELNTSLGFLYKVFPAAPSSP